MAYAALALAILWSLAAAMAIDYALELTRLQRLVTLVAIAGVVLWAARRFALPWFGHQESDLDIALLVEKQQKIDSDLVAALQFETPEARDWGSPALEAAVVDYVAEFGQSYNLFEGVASRDATRRLKLLAATVALVAIGALLAPHHFAAFLNRLLLGSAHYPTATRIERVLVGGRELDIRPGADAVLKAPYGQPLKFVVESSGEQPRSGRVELRVAATGGQVRVDLEPALVGPSGGAKPDIGTSAAAGPTTAAGASAAPGPAAPGGSSDVSNGAAPERAPFTGQLAKLTDTLECQIYLGDAWTDPARLVVVPLPVVEARFEPVPPAYARNVAIENSAGSRQISVIEGSRIDAALACGNKRLAEAWLTIDAVKYPLTKTGADDARSGRGEVWSLAAAGTPLARVEKPLRWEAQVVDADGLGLERPLEGFIRIKADQRPRIVAEVVTKTVLPTAAPLVEYRATDDFGLSRIVVRLERVAADGAAQSLGTLPAREFRKPLLAERLPLKDSYRLELSPLKLVKGDQLKVTLEAVDYRGEAPGESTQSEPLVLQVTDESGVLAAISEADERSAQQLDAIITRQLGIGDQK